MIELMQMYQTYQQSKLITDFYWYADLLLLLKNNFTGRKLQWDLKTGTQIMYSSEYRIILCKLLRFIVYLDSNYRTQCTLLIRVMNKKWVKYLASCISAIVKNVCWFIIFYIIQWFAHAITRIKSRYGGTYTCLTWLYVN